MDVSELKSNIFCLLIFKLNEPCNYLHHMFQLKAKQFFMMIVGKSSILFFLNKDSIIVIYVLKIEEPLWTIFAKRVLFGKK